MSRLVQIFQGGSAGNPLSGNSLKKILNIPRFAAKNFKGSAGKGIWISISEPNDQKSVIDNEILGKLPTLRLSFWDLTESVKHDGETIHPPDENIAKEIVDFLLSHKDMNVIVNCAAGISRSGAVAQFCEDFLGYEWLEMGKKNALPNSVLYKLMRDYFLSLTKPK